MEEYFRSVVPKEDFTKIEGEGLLHGCQTNIIVWCKVLACQEVLGPEEGVTEMRLICWMCDHMRMDKIRNVVIRNKVGVSPIEDKRGEGRV